MESIWRRFRRLHWIWQAVVWLLLWPFLLGLFLWRYPGGGWTTKLLAAVIFLGLIGIAAASPNLTRLRPRTSEGSPDLTSTSPQTSPAPSTSSSACRSDPHANVYHPNRLRVIDPCKTVTGRVMAIRREEDGDVHFDVELDPELTGLLTSGNYSQQHGWMVIEIVPADRPGCVPGNPPLPSFRTYDYGICSGANIQPPPINSRVRVTGPYVLDTVHSWAEIHPAWEVVVLNSGSR